ncbi:MAG: hypothetical protein AB8H79_08510 [Myxococcota bacterium]
MLLFITLAAFAGDLRPKAAKHRPADHPADMAWVQLWQDSHPGNTATVREVTLDPSKENEVCNGLDDDSNGKIDENCGLQTGGFQAVVSWDHHADIDIEVLYSPWENTSHKWGSGKVQVTHGYGNEPIPEKRIGEGRDGAVLKIQENRHGSCSCGSECTEIAGETWAAPEHYVENLFVAGDKAPSGIYTLKFYNHKACGASSGDQVSVNVAVGVNGKLIGHYKSGDIGSQSFSYPIMHVYVP